MVLVKPFSLEFGDFWLVQSLLLML